MLTEFISLIRQWIDVAIYVLTGQGQTITSADQIRSMEDTTTNANRAIALWTARGKRCVCFDCSGLIVWALMKMGLVNADMRADGIYDKCPKIAKSELSLGDFAYRINSVGNAHHVGIVTKIINGVSWITEAKGRDDGVVERPIDADPGYWERYTKNIFIAEASGGGGEDVLSKGDKGDQVVAWQKALIKTGYPLPKYGADGDFGGETEGATKAFQTAKGLPATGIVTTPVFCAMTTELLKVESADKAQLDAAKIKIASMTVDLTEANNQLLIKTNKISAAQTALS